ncbi:MAG: MotA/TolQ/ExbB proton channel family protein [Geminicoccaceae bacterium]|nr:MotA/TolQ/ExbB proton channel family protein [Geminicoccaceae bacterium]
MSVDLVDVYRSLLGHWPGLILLALSVLTLAFVLATLWVMLRPDALNRRPQRHQLASGLRFCEEAAPAVGLVGTVYGLTGGFFAVGTEELPAFIGTALQTTYVGGILFLLALAARMLVEETPLPAIPDDNGSGSD